MAEMAGSAAATKCTEVLVDKVMKELPYLCCYKSYAADFEERKKELLAAVESVDMKIEEAKRRNETQIDPTVKYWVKKANNIIQQETRPKKWFGFCTDWFSQYSLAKKLERIMQEIPTITEKAGNFSQVAHTAERPGMEFCSQEFMHFKSRNSVYEQLREKLKDDNNYRIGLQAMGGSGKTTMAKEVGKELENSKTFDKVIFIEVPNPIDEKKSQDEIAKKLELTLENGKDLTEQIWIRITNIGNVLIILDDVWEELKLKNIGIYGGIHTQGRCCVLLTTRYETICRRMSCQETIKLGVLPEEDAVDLFLHHAHESGKDCPNKLKLLASKVVNECGNLPVIVVALARTYRNWDPNEWEDAFVVTKKASSLRHENTDEEEKKFYNSLKISFKCLDIGAQDLILLCSLFPRAYEIPLELLSRIAIGFGLCENVDSYYTARSQVLSIKTTLVRSALLLTARQGCVKMHDVIRDMAHQIGDEKIQVMIDSKSKLKENVKYSSWMIDDFSDFFGGNNLEVLLVWVNASRSLEVPKAFFGGMKGLRVLLLCSKFQRTVALSLPKSIHSLENIQTLSLTNWELGDISILQKLKKLITLELTDCSIIELPNDISLLEKLKLLGLVRCSIERNNPFEVIGRCSKLEALYYVSNDDTLKNNAKPSKIIDLHQEFELYHIEGIYFYKRSFQLDASTKKYFNSTKLQGILSESTIKSLTARAEILELTECNETRWTNLVPDMVHPNKDEGMNGLVRLSLKSWPAIQCLINMSGIQYDATIFSNLVELRLHDMRVRELCHGDSPSNFLKQLEKLYLSSCAELDGTLFNESKAIGEVAHKGMLKAEMPCK
ncbi:probable disease resistance protein At4g27220 [Neltuma alba]|uniref:probable disease resistance protein At4g27220 n=1 Tax=Neltuma alba TaxID=207710 RepID=UPI0010A50571|nr:probable disease resistance protein At4g27220 [Prosopis alba]